MYTSFDNDIDFIKFWKSNIQFFSYYVILARKYSVFYKNEEFLLEYLRQRGLLICDDETFENLRFLMKNFYEEIRKRGTIEIIDKYSNNRDQSDSYSDSIPDSTPTINGELLRTICLDECDEFIFNFRESHKFGFNIGNASPMYRGTSDMINKIWDDFSKQSNYLNFPLFGISHISSVSEGDESDSDSNSDALLNSAYSLLISRLDPAQYAGIGLDNISTPRLSYINQYAINVDNNIDYEFTFRVKCNQSVIQFLNVGVNAFDCDGNTETLIDMTDITLPNASIYFIQNESVNKANKYYFFRGVIYSKNKYQSHSSSTIYKRKVIVRSGSSFYVCIKQTTSGILISNTSYWTLLDTTQTNLITKTNWNTWNNLQFTQNVKKIIPFIKITNSSDPISKVYIDNIFLKPVATNYSSGFINSSNWIDLWIKNNNQNYTYTEIKELFRKYLLPIDVEFEINQLEEQKQL